MSRRVLPLNPVPILQLVAQSLREIAPSVGVSLALVYGEVTAAEAGGEPEQQR